MNRFKILTGAIAFVIGVAVAVWAFGPAAPPVLVWHPPTPDTPYRVFQIGSDRVNQILVCGGRAAYVGAAGTEQGCVAVEVPETWGGWTARAVVCGTQAYVADTGQPCRVPGR